MARQEYEEHTDDEEFEEIESVVSSETDDTEEGAGPLPSSYHIDLYIHPCLRSENPSPLLLGELVNDGEVHKKPHRSRKRTRIRAWTAQKRKEGYDVAEKAMRSGVEHARTWSARQREESHVARKKLRSGIEKAKGWGARQSKESINHTQEENNGIRGAESCGVEIQEAIREILQQAREECANTYLRPYVPSRDSDDESLYETELSENPAWLPLNGIAIRIKLPLPPHWRSLDIPVASSVKDYECCTYFPETDTHFVPDEEGGPFEVPAARGENETWFKPYPEQFWEFRNSALEELKFTGRIHWRKANRWGIPWEESRWKEDIRPVWNPKRKMWDRSMMDL